MAAASEDDRKGQNGRISVLGGAGSRPLWAALAATGILIVLAATLLLGDGETTVPSVVGLDEEAAGGALVSNDLSTTIDRQRSPEPPGTVIGQDPDPGTEVGAGEVVTLTVSGDPSGGDVAEQPTGPVEVPDVVGRQYVLAGASLEQAGLVPDTLMVERGQRWGVVVAQRPPSGATLDAGETIELDVALAAGADRLDIPVPDLEGRGAAEARSEARELGFTTRTIERDAPSADLVGTVLEQDLEPGATVPELSPIRLVVGR